MNTPTTPLEIIPLCSSAIDDLARALATNVGELQDLKLRRAGHKLALASKVALELAGTPNAADVPRSRPDTPDAPRPFFLQRDNDETGVSGTGRVAEGVVFSSGRVVVAFLTAPGSVTHWDSLADAEAIHGHDGKTRFIFP